jgi:two-component system cell cycle sensor histidine kinase/response regulator CckA
MEYHTADKYNLVDDMPRETGRMENHNLPKVPSLILETAIATSLVPIAFADIEGRISYANQSFVELFGYSSGAEIVGRFNTEFTPESEAVGEVMRVVRSEGRWKGELTARRRDGGLLRVLLSASLVCDDAGTPLCTMASFVDVTEQRQAEEKTKESNTLYETLVESVDGVVWQVELPALRFTFVSPQVEQMLGYPVQRWLDEPTFWADHIHPDDRVEAVDFCLMRTRSGKAHDFKYRMIAADGRIVWIHDLVTVWMENGQPAKLRGLMVDITEHQRAEEALRESEDRFHTLVEQAADAFFVHDFDGRILEVNRRACESLGYSKAELAQMTVFDLEQNHCPESAKELWKEIHPGHFGTWPGVHKRKDGTCFPVEIRSGCIESQSQRLFLDLVRDITERKRAETISEAMLSLETRLGTASTPSEAARIIFDVADQLWKWDAGTLDVYSPGSDSVWSVMYLDVIDGKRCEVPPAEESSKPTARMRRIMEKGAELILRAWPYAQDLDGILFGDTSRLSASILCVPIRWQRQALGVLSIQSYRAKAFDNTDLRVLQSLADSCGGTLERIRATESLRKSEASFRAIFETEPECVKIVTRQGELAEMNPAGLAMIEVDSLTQAKSYPLTDWIAPEHREGFRRLHRLVMSGEPGTLEFEIIGAKGTRRWLETRAAPLRDQHGRVTALLGVTRDTTERKRAEEAVRASQLMLQTILDNIPQGVFWKDRMSRYLGCNRVVARAFNVGHPSGLLGKTDYDLPGLTREQASFFVQKDQEVMESGESQLGIIEQATLADGSALWLETNKIPLRDQAGAVIGVLGTWQDITARKEADEKLRQSEAGLVRAQRIARLGSWELDLESGALEWSNETYRIFGLKAETGQPTREQFIERVHPEDRERLQSMVAKAIHDRQPYQIEHRIRWPDGTLRFVSEHADLVFDAQGRPIRMVGTVLDITQLKEAELALQRSERHFRSLIENAQDLIALLDAAGVMQFLSPSLQRLLEHPPEAMLGRSVFEFIHPDDVSMISDALARAASHVEPPTLTEVRFRHANGTWRTFESIGRRLTGEDPPMIVVNSRDVTQRKQLEDQLRQSQKMQAIGRLAGGVAHDFNNLLTVMQGHISLLLMSPKLDSAEKEFAQQVALAVERAAALTRQLLLFGRKQSMRPGRLDLNDIVANMSKMLHRILGEDIKLQLEPAAHLPLVQADTGMMEQVLLNLAVNSRDAMPKGGRLIIRTHAQPFDEELARQRVESESGSVVCLSVSDSGCGIPAEHLPRIFEPFFTTKDVGKGTGLGLATVYGIVSEHHGSIEVESVVGQGTTFFVFLPALAGTALPADVRVQDRPARGGTETILLVEDEATVRSLARFLLERLGYHVLEASDGPSALRIWNKDKSAIQLLITDMIMPEGMTGHDLAERLRSERPELQVLLTSGYSAEMSRQGAKLGDGIKFLQKPYQLREFGEAVRDCLDKGSVTNEEETNGGGGGS